MLNILKFAAIQERFDGVEHGELIAPCEIHFLGESPQTRVRAEWWDNSIWEEVEPRRLDKDGHPVMRQRSPGFREYDRLVDATVTAPTPREPYYIITGTSERLVNVNQLPPDQAIAEWRVTLHGCQDCS